MNWSVLRKPSFYFLASVNAALLQASQYICNTYVRPLPMFYDTDNATWQSERFAITFALMCAGLLVLQKSRMLPKL